ncbi:MAG: anaerobic ribonucleoside-triphosphate reductase activating protein [Patescibacteria group bacterium]|jgi:pyruvate formate lyase activating enzyme
MKIGGLQKLSLLDYPEHIAAIIFTQGCNFRCHFCYNPKLVVPQKDYSLISEDSLFEFLRKRKGKIDSVVITGGEPTIHLDLPEFIRKIRELGYLTKLDTNGTNPKMLEFLIQKKLIDYIAMDIKAPLNKYQEVVGVKNVLANITKSIIIIKESRLPHEFRSTIIPCFHKEKDIVEMGKMIWGADKWYLQKFKPMDSLVNEKFSQEKAYTDKEMGALSEIGSKYVKYYEIR